TFGIIFSAGISEPQCRGMLPCGEGIAGDNGPIQDGLVDRFDFTRETKEDFHASFQSNSWSNGTGAYDVYSYELDEIVWRLDMAIVQSAGNSGDSPLPNLRVDAEAKNVISIGGTHHEDTLDLADDWWCGAEIDCSAHAGDQAACDADPNCRWLFGSCFDNWICASCGPTTDDRIKPDLGYWVHGIFTTDINNGYTTKFYGTSAAAPMAAGALGLLLEMWADTSNDGLNPWGHSPAGSSVFDKQPHAATMKALLINSAEQYQFSGVDHDLTRMHQGWGRPNVQNAKQRAARSLVVDEEHALEEGNEHSWRLEVEPGEKELKVTLVYLDPPKTLASGGKQLLNDLDLKVVSPEDVGGDVTVYCGNYRLTEGMSSVAAWTGPGPAESAPDCDDPALSSSRDALNNVENVYVREASPGSGVTAGSWLIEVKAYAVNVDQNALAACKEIDLDPMNPSAGQAACEAAGCEWDGTHGLCGDLTDDVVFGLVVTGAAEGVPGVSNGLTITRAGEDSLHLSWNPDCGNGAAYGVYRGDLLVGYSSMAPEPGQCDVSTTSATIPLGPGTADFFLVVPNTGSAEGSYGRDSAPARRPQASAACYPQEQIHHCAP
ncbi:MAG: S8 family serine peptidase, partial [Acidobacteriota bacterium]